MKNFCSAQDIEELAARGRTELVIDDNTVLTDLARHAADQLGIKIVHKSPAGAAAASAQEPGPAAPVLARPTAIRPGSKPKGCQHGSRPGNPAPGPVVAANGSGPGPNSGTVVEQLVGLVKRLGNKGTGS